MPAAICECIDLHAFLLEIPDQGRRAVLSARIFRDHFRRVDECDFRLYIAVECFIKPRVSVVRALHVGGRQQLLIAPEQPFLPRSSDIRAEEHALLFPLQLKHEGSVVAEIRPEAVHGCIPGVEDGHFEPDQVDHILLLQISDGPESLCAPAKLLVDVIFIPDLSGPPMTSWHTCGKSVPTIIEPQNIAEICPGGFGLRLFFYARN